jgi:drug/metabolite transporter (DMT)-like permease
MKTRFWAIIVMILCTLFTAIGQVFQKSGANGDFKLILQTIASQGVIESINQVFTNPIFFPIIFVFIGFVLFGIGWVLMIVSFKGGELSVLYPVYAVNYVWVAVLAVKVFGEVFNTWKIIGVFAIVLGIALIGIGGRNGN